MDVEFMVTVYPENRDSYMFHSANIDAVAAIANVAGINTSRYQLMDAKKRNLLILKQASPALMWKA